MLESGELYRLIHGDCLEVMRGLPAGAFDAVGTDPPFGIGFKYATHDDTPEGYGGWLWSVMQ
jgi:DNA modification methylase